MLTATPPTTRNLTSWAASKRANSFKSSISFIVIRQQPRPQLEEQRHALGVREMRVLVDQARFLAEPHDADDPLDSSGLSVAHPTAPSRLTSSSFFASTANSIGSSRKTSRQKPSTIIETASSSPIPRERQ